MTDTAHPPVLAIDGGGTRCRFVYAHGDQRVVVEGGAANAFSDFDGTVACILAGLAKLERQAQTPVTALPAFIGLAGVTSAAVAGRLKQALPMGNARYGEDKLPALRGALGDQDGILAHCGTGSFFGAQTGGKHRTAGGWGSTLGDEASAYWVARKALSGTLRVADGFAPATGMSDAFLTQFGGTDGVLRFVQSATPKDIAALAPDVTNAAENGDAQARRILQAGTDYIADGFTQMGWTPGIPLCLTGGIGPVFAPYLSDPMQADLAEPKASPLEGAIALARAGQGGF